MTGADAEKIGLVMKAAPADVLEDEVEGLADRFSLIDPDLLTANKRISNLALELMGAQTLQPRRHDPGGKIDITPLPGRSAKAGLIRPMPIELVETSGGRASRSNSKTARLSDGPCIPTRRR